MKINKLEYHQIEKVLFLLIILTVSSCKKEGSMDYAIIKGKITNNSNDQVKLKNVIRTEGKNIKVSEDGSFTDTLTTTPQNYNLIYKNNSAFVYLEGGSVVHVEFDANNFINSLIFSGTGQDINLYINAKSNMEKDILGEERDFYKLDEIAFKEKCKKLKSIVSEMISTTKNLPEDFKSRELRAINYKYLYYLSNYQEEHRYYTDQPNFEVVSKDFLSELDGLDYSNEEDFFYSFAYTDLVEKYYSTKAQELSEMEGINWGLAWINVVEKIKNENVKNYMLYHKIRFWISLDTENGSDYYNAFILASTNEDYKKEITEIYKRKTRLAKGSPSPKFANYKNHAGGTTSLDDLKGKFVYIDIWATWCKPCIAEIPALKKLQAEYFNRNINFVSISVDNMQSYLKWKEMVEDKELGGIQLFADKEFNSQFIRDYQIRGIPRFILIDPDGNIISSNAPRPSSKKLTELFIDNGI